MTKKEFFELADSVCDCDATSQQIARFEESVEKYPEWMDEWVDQKTALQAMLGCPPIESSPEFGPSLLARWRAEKVRLSVQYWAPAALAAVAAAVGLIAVLQVMSAPVQSATFGRPEAEAKLESAESVPFPSHSEPLSK